MSRGESYGGGQSSLGYLFGSKDGQPPNKPPPLSPSKAVSPPYGTDIEDGKPPHSPDFPQQTDTSNNNNDHRGHGSNTRNLITDRPSTRVKSVPGGSSSLGYLFGDK